MTTGPSDAARPGPPGGVPQARGGGPDPLAAAGRSLPEPTVITGPGVYDGIPDHVYHADPVPGGSLSSTGARRLLPPSCPALYRWWADHGQPPKRAFDFGRAAHHLVLGIGAPITAVDADDWRGKAAREARDAAYAAGETPVLAAEYAAIEAMADAIRGHPFAGRLFSGEGTPEQSMFWVDPEFGVWRRARVDWFPKWSGKDRLLVPDYKTCVSAEPDACSRAMHSYGYHIQAPYYLDAVRALDLADDAVFLFVFQEKTPPYLVTVVEPDPVAMDIGRRRIREALDVYTRCRDTGQWPPYSNDVVQLPLPAWVEKKEGAA